MKRKNIWLPVMAMIIFSLLFSAACGGAKKPQPTIVPVQTPGVIASPTATPQAAPGPDYHKPHSKPGPAVDKIEFGSSHVDQALAELEAGKIDLYLFGLKIAAAKKLAKSADVKAFRNPASSLSLLLNPAPASENQLNPFSLPEVRKAMNYLIDRQFITQEIYGGMAVPMTSHVSPLDFDYLTVYEKVLSKQSAGYDFEYARNLIAQTMQKAGAELKDGKWHFKGKPIRVKFIIRVEDERREAGDFIRVALEKVGFQVEPVYKTFAAAIYTVYTSDPQTFEWHLYTEGWGRGAAQKYDDANINQMTAPWMGNMPGWQIAGFWQYQNSTLDELGKKLFTGEFKSKEERDALYRQMTEISLEDSIRVWLATIYNTFPAGTNLLGVTEDLVAGPRGVLALREAFIPNKDSLRVGNLWVWTERTVWNPVAGFEDVYSVDIWKNLYDPALIQHPFSGLPVSFRAGFEVASAGPTGKLEIPDGVFIWDAQNDRWQSVPRGTQATSKVIFDYSKYFQTTWHHGRPITMADVVYSIYQAFERTYDSEKSRIEFVLAATQKPRLDTFRGFRILDENRLEVYIDYWHFEKAHIASYASPTDLTMPWEILAAMDKLVFQDRMAAYSKTAAAKYNVRWLSLVMGQDSAMVARNLRGFAEEAFLPANVFNMAGRSLVSANEAKARYQAALAWHETKKHLVVSQGAFMLNRYEPSAQYAELLAFRDKNYPFRPGDWYMGTQPSVEFKEVNISPGVVRVKLEGPGELSLNYLLLNPSTGEVRAQGEAEKAGPGEFKISFASEKGRQVLRLHLLATSAEVALVKEKKVDIVVQ